MRLQIGIDLMGGDNPPELLFPAVLQAVEQVNFGHFLHVIATKQSIIQLYSLFPSLLSSEIFPFICFQECEEVVSMADDPLESVRHKKNSSLALGMRLLKKRSIDALVSCGNTGALIASAAIHLPLLSGISHPALLLTLPTEKGPVAILDVGGNVLNTAFHLVDFAFFGAAYQHAVYGIKTPRVGLLNVGIESYKGTTEVRQAHEILKSHCQGALADSMCFSGNIEGRDLFKGVVDVLVTDGFTGNVLLKTAEGVASFIFDVLQDKLNACGVPAFESVFKDLKKQFNYAQYPGAIVCGIDAVVIKVHGNANAETLLISIFSAIDCLEKQVIQLTKYYYKQIQKQRIDAVD